MLWWCSRVSNTTWTGTKITKSKHGGCSLEGFSPLYFLSVSVATEITDVCFCSELKPLGAEWPNPHPDEVFRGMWALQAAALGSHGARIEHNLLIPQSRRAGEVSSYLQRVFPQESSHSLILDVDNSPPFFSKLLLILNTSLCLLCMNRLTVALLNY